MRVFISLFLFCCCYVGLHAAPSFLTLSDIHYGSKVSPSDHSDTDDQLWTTTLDKFKQLSASTDFIILLGDLPDHDLVTTEEKSCHETKVFNDLFIANTAKKPIFYVPGNNDSLLGNYQPFSRGGNSPIDNAQQWDGGACANCNGLIIDNSLMHDKGFYSTYVIPGNNEIALIVLNATQFTKLPWWSLPYPEQGEDAAQQLEWFAKQLQQIKAKQLLIAMHEEPGVDYENTPVWNEPVLAQFIQLLNTAQQKQISLLTAHSHYDELRKITLANGSSLFSYSTPSISRSHYNNSAMKIFTLTDDYIIKDFTTYYTASNNQWGNDHYHAIRPKNSIFPSCKGKNLVECLNSLSTQEICTQWEINHIYGVKNPKVLIKNCLAEYEVVGSSKFSTSLQSQLGRTIA